MERKAIKELAKSKIKGKKWDIWWPLLLISVVETIIEKIFGLDSMSNFDFDYVNFTVTSNFKVEPGKTVIAIVVGILFGIIAIAYKKYILNMVRDQKFEFNDIINCIKEKWLNIIVVELLVGVIVTLFSMVFVIPGIIMALAYGMVAYIVVDTDLGPKETLKESREMMKGHKWNYFVFGLSFIGWIILVPFTLGILIIWLLPYMTVADALYYDTLKEAHEKNKVK